MLCLRQRKKKKVVSDEAQAATVENPEEKKQNQDVVEAGQTSQHPLGNTNDQPSANNDQSSSGNGVASGVDHPTSACDGDGTSTCTAVNSKPVCNRSDGRLEDGDSSRSPGSGSELNGHGHGAATKDQPFSTSDRSFSNNGRGCRTDRPSSACDDDAVGIRATASDDRACSEQVCNGHDKHLGDSRSSGNLASSSGSNGHGPSSVIVDQGPANSAPYPSSNGRTPSADRPTSGYGSDGTTISEVRAQSDLSLTGLDDDLEGDGNSGNPERSELRGHGQCGAVVSGVGDSAVAVRGCPEGQGDMVGSGQDVVSEDDRLRVRCGENSAGAGTAGIGKASCSAGRRSGIIEDSTTGRIPPAMVDGGVAAPAHMGVGAGNTKVVEAVGKGREGTVSADVDGFVDEESEGIRTTSKRAKMTDFATEKDHYA